MSRYNIFEVCDSHKSILDTKLSIWYIPFTHVFSKNVCAFREFRFMNAVTKSNCILKIELSINLLIGARQ